MNLSHSFRLLKRGKMNTYWILPFPSHSFFSTYLSPHLPVSRLSLSVLLFLFLSLLISPCPIILFVPLSFLFALFSCSSFSTYGPFPTLLCFHIFLFLSLSILLVKNLLKKISLQKQAIKVPHPSLLAYPTLIPVTASSPAFCP